MDERRGGTTLREDVEGNRARCYGGPPRRPPTLPLLAFFLTLIVAVPLVAQSPAPFDQQLRDNQQRLESIRRERSDVEHELERLRTQVHSLSHELANIE